MACGTPAIAFPIGGIPEIVRHDVNGWLAKEISSRSLSQAINSALESQEHKAIRANCRSIIENEYSLDSQAIRYMALFQELLG